MKKTVVSFGRRRQKQDSRKGENDRSPTGALSMGLFALGVAAICASIVIPISTSRAVTGDDAVAAMSDNVEREILVANEVPADANEDFSIFEYIGEAVAYLLTGVK